MLDELEVRLYLTRIGMSSSFTLCEIPTFERLKELQLAHLYHVPFENLSITLKQPLVLGDKAAYQKIVGDNRGGFCYELNYAFYQLLRALHFDVQLLCAQVFNSQQQSYGQPYDHLVLLVRLNQQEYIVDVGFGDSFIEPININARISEQENSVYQLSQEQGQFVLSRQEAGKANQIQYRFTLAPKTIDDFSEMFVYHQTNPASTFTQKSVCSRLTDYGRVTLSNGLLIRTEDNQKHKLPISNESQVRQVLSNEFGVHFSEQKSLAMLLK